MFAENSTVSALTWSCRFPSFSREVDFVKPCGPCKHLHAFVALFLMCSQAGSMGRRNDYLHNLNIAAWSNDLRFCLTLNGHFQSNQLVGRGSHDFDDCLLLWCKVETLFLFSYPKTLIESIEYCLSNRSILLKGTGLICSIHI